MEEIKDQKIDQIQEDEIHHLYQIPSLEGSPSKLWVIGIIDTSKSMDPWWPWLLLPSKKYFIIGLQSSGTKRYQRKMSIQSQYNFYYYYCKQCFDSKPRICPINTLSENLKAHGGGGTEIPGAFKVFEEKIQQIPLDEHITTIFISDGQDNYFKTLEKRLSELKGNYGRRINFICLGIQNEFPTFLAMRFRNLYHNGDSQIPALYLIEYASEKAFFNKFETMKKYFANQNILDVIPGCRLFPWEEPITEIFERTWVIAEEDFVMIQDQQYDINPQELTIDNIVEVFRSWVQQLQLLSFEDKKRSQQAALICLKQMNYQIEKFNQLTGIDLKLNKKPQVSNFRDDALYNYMKITGIRIQWFLEEVTNLSQGNNPQDLNEFEAAKKLQLGTIAGKRQQRILALKVITVEEFFRIKKEFELIFKGIQLSGTEESNQEKSIFSLRNQKDVFLEHNFLDGLRFCQSQFDLFEAFPIIGLSLRIKRYIGFETDPWLFEVKSIGKHHRTIESSILIQNDCALQLNIGGTDQKEHLNCLVPLFRKTDSVLSPLLNTTLFRLVLSYFCTSNPDHYFRDAYQSLLSNTLIYLVTQETQSEYKDNLIQQIYETFMITYMKEDTFIQFNEKITKRFRSLFQEQHIQQQKTVPNLTQLITHLFVSLRSTTLTPEKAQQVFHLILIEWFSRLFAANSSQFAQFIYPSYNKDSICQHFHTFLHTYRSVSQFQKEFKQEITNYLLGKLEICSLNHNLLYSDSMQQTAQLTLSTLEKLYSFFFSKQLTDEFYIQLLYHVNINRAELHRFDNPIQTDIHIINKFALNSIKKKNIMKMPPVIEAFKQLKIDIIKNFAQKHWDIKPINLQQLQNICQEKGIDQNGLILNEETGLLKNACQSEKCYYFLKIFETQRDLKKHLDTWVNHMPRGFHLFIKEHIKLKSEEIYDIFVKEKLFAPEKYSVTKQFTMEYIEKVQKWYQEI